MSCTAAHVTSVASVATAPPRVTGGPGVYRRRRPAATLLHRTVREHLETYLAGGDHDTGQAPYVPAYVRTSFEKYLKCGILAHGFARVYCAGCGHDFLVAFSCKGRDICPSCATRRMVETTIRQRSPGAPPTARFGAVAFVHRFGGYLNRHIHFHVLVTDGVFSADGDGGAVFHPAVDLTAADFEAVQRKMRKRGLRWLHRHGHLDDHAIHTLDTPDHAGGWSIHAGVTIPGWDRQGLERLVRYCARPPLSQERLGRLDDEQLVYRLRRPTLDGRTELVLTPLELLDKLAHLVTPPRLHKHRYCGVLALNAKLRRAVTESAGPAGATLQLLEAARDRMGLTNTPGDADELDTRPASTLSRAAARCWALLLVRIYECLPLLCPRCGEPMRIIAFVQETAVVEKILTHIGEPASPPAICLQTLKRLGPPAAEFVAVQALPAQKRTELVAGKAGGLGQDSQAVRSGAPRSFLLALV